ncbi:WD repeat domain-containing protein 83 [Teleopsis dalmanni]|uniref:WD repeat domain-containing protein 83 n=1 Tax=Teleopsis dalmanni TaxID=139649 RepID=UPI0018CCDAC3|nr:WD repeat domain-containing protein 83 [Teleopsis dalmanni]
MSTNFEKYHCQKMIDCKQGAVRAVRYNIDGFYCLSCGSDKKVKLWNPETGLLLKTYGGHADEVTDARGSCDSSYIVSSSLDKSVIYWDVTTGRPVRRLHGHAGGVRCVRFNENSSIVVSGGRDNAIMCWDIRSRRYQPVQTMKEARDSITSLLVIEHKIIASSLDGCIRHYDLRAGELICDKVSESITCIALSRDEMCLVTACQDSVVRLLDCDDGGVLNEYKGHNASDYHIECGIMPNDKQILCGSDNGEVFLWDLLTGKVLQRIRISSNGGIINSLDTHPSAEQIVFARRRDIYVYSTTPITEQDC